MLNLLCVTGSHSDLMLMRSSPGGTARRTMYSSLLMEKESDGDRLASAAIASRLASSS
jgi:hypothetical protein